MKGIFGAAYAEMYDGIYADKDYAGECVLVERLFAAYGAGDARSVLDLGCGTGSHAIRLAKDGYAVVGVDNSHPMLARARTKAREAGVEDRVRFLRRDVRALDLGHRFDAVLMMFAVLGYQRSDDDVRSALAAVRRHLRPGGVFIFDVWFGPAVLAQKPSRRSKTVSIPGGEILRTACAAMEPQGPLCTVEIVVQITDVEGVREKARERHVMRYFFPEDLEAFLRAADLKLLRTGSFEDFNRSPDTDSWNVLCVATTGAPV